MSSSENNKIKDKIFTLLASLLYLFVIIYGYKDYIFDQWGYFGFRYSELHGQEYLVVIFNVMTVAFFLPTNINSPSSIILILLYISVIVPSQFLITIHKVEKFIDYQLLSLFTSTSFVIPCIWTRISSQPETFSRLSIHGRINRLLPTEKFGVILILSNIIACCVLVYKFHSIMRFVGVTEVYEQRSAASFGESLSDSIFINYTSSILTGFLAPAAVAVGLSRKEKVVIIFGVISCLVSYMINASKMVLVTPVLMLFLYFLVQKVGARKIKTWSILLGLSTLFVLALLLGDHIPLFDIIRVHGLLRGVIITGFTIPLYYELVSESGYLYWSNLKVFNLFIDPPVEYASDPLWPNLGYIVSARVLGVVENNYNANLFAGDGVAAAGFLGLLVIGVTLAIILGIFDRLTDKWADRFKLLIAFNFGYILINGHLSTTMLSYGSFLWFYLFYVWNKKVVPEAD